MPVELLIVELQKLATIPGRRVLFGSVSIAGAGLDIDGDVILKAGNKLKS